LNNSQCNLKVFNKGVEWIELAQDKDSWQTLI